MIGSFALSWAERKDELKKYIETHPQREYGESYIGLVRLLFNIVINPDVKNGDYYRIDKDDIDEIDHDTYCGTLIFVLHKSEYPSVSDYVYTSVEYGSCSVCDTLQGIQSDDVSELPNEKQVEGYMQLLLNLLQNCHLMKGEE